MPSLRVNFACFSSVNRVDLSNIFDIIFYAYHISVQYNERPQGNKLIDFHSKHPEFPSFATKYLTILVWLILFKIFYFLIFIIVCYSIWCFQIFHLRYVLSISEKILKKVFLLFSFQHSLMKPKDSLETRAACSWILILTWNFGGSRSDSTSTFFKIASAS